MEYRIIHNGHLFKTIEAETERDALEEAYKRLKLSRRIGTSNSIEALTPENTSYPKKPEIMIEICSTGEVFSFYNKRVYIGHGWRSNLIPADNMKLSMVHLMITRDGEQFFVMDYNTANGSFISEEKRRLRGLTALDEDRIVWAVNQKFRILDQKPSRLKKFFHFLQKQQ